MAQTNQASSAATTKKLFEEQLFRDTKLGLYFAPWMGKGADSIIQEKTHLEKSQGDEITFGLIPRIDGDGVEDDEILEGNEKALDVYDFKVTLKQYRQAIKDRGAIHRQRAMFKMKVESRTALETWGKEKMDSLAFSELCLNRSTILFPDASGNFDRDTEANAKLAMNATNGKLDLDFITELKTWAKSGGNRQYIPVRPAMVKGKSYYILLTHDEALCDLKKTSEYKSAMRDAQTRGDENPIFTGADAIFDGVVIHSHEKVPVATDGGGASVRYCKSVLMGQQSLVWAWGKRPKIVEKDFDYENQESCAWGMIARPKKPVFNGQDYGSLGVYLACSNITGQ